MLIINKYIKITCIFCLGFFFINISYANIKVNNNEIDEKQNANSNLSRNEQNINSLNNQYNTQTYSGKVEQVVSIDLHLLNIYKLIAQQKYTEALKNLDIILQKYPNFTLALALKNDLLTINNKNVNHETNTSNTQILNKNGLINLENNYKSVQNSAALIEEAKLRIKALYERPDARLIPRSILNLAPNQKTALVVDPVKSRIYVYENVNGRPKFLFDYYISIGKKGFEKEQEGDNKTPLGVYELNKPIDKKKLPDMYGYGAMPLNFPNDWDTRNNITGTNIWIHGVPKNTYSRPPRASEGCIVLTNPDLERLFKFTQIKNTPVIINKNIEWLDLDKWKKEHNEAMDLLKQWQEAWDTYDFETYKNFYSTNMFKSDKKTYEQWIKKYNIFFEEKKIRLQNMRNISIYRYPTIQPTLLINFEQDMMIPNILSKEKDKMKQSVMKKRQYWQYDGIRWEIIYENEN